MAVLQFIFSNFWVWLGVTILALGILGQVTETVKSFRKPERELQVTSYNDHTIIANIKNPEPGDYDRVISAIVREIKDREPLEPALKSEGRSEEE